MESGIYTYISLSVTGIDMDIYAYICMCVRACVSLCSYVSLCLSVCTVVHICTCKLARFLGCLVPCEQYQIKSLCVANFSYVHQLVH